MRLPHGIIRFYRFLIARPNFCSLASGAVWFCFSLTPSLLPRPAILQGAVTGISFAVGYAIGVGLSWAARKVFRPKITRITRRAAWIALGVIGGGSMLATIVLYFVNWQNEVRALVEEPELESGHRVLIFVVAALTAWLLIICGRAVYWLIRWTDRRLARYIPRRFSGAAATLIVLIALYFIFNGLAYRGFVHLANNTYRAANNGTPAGVTRPTSALRSGNPESRISWESLGRQGRRFTGSGPSASQLQAFNNAKSAEPIRIYAGLDSAPTAKERARLAEQELERTHAYDRPVLVVITPTGTGWINPQTVDSLEYMWNGNTAMVGMQYSYLPSWISFLVDKDNATDAGRELFAVVYEHWSTLPPDHRPKLIAYGLSLGSYGMQAAFSGQDDLKNRTDGALFVGTPNDTYLWRDLENHRDPGSPAWQPIYDNGTTIRFGAHPDDLKQPATDWQYPRVVYLQHASDPIVWWSPHLLFRQPDWLKEARGSDVSPAMHWFPVSTFLQVTVDQFVGISPPDGHGHNYNTSPIAAWADLLPPPNWNETRAANLTELIGAYADR